MNSLESSELHRRRSIERKQIAKMVEGESKKADRIRTLIEGSLGLIPGVGSGAEALFKLAWGSAFEKQARKMLEMLLGEVLELDERLRDVEVLTERLRDPEVAAVGLTAVSISGRTSSDEKLQYIAAGASQVIAGAEPWGMEVEFALVLMHLVDDLTATQLAMLAFLADPSKWEERNDSSISSLPVNGEGRLETVSVISYAFGDRIKEPPMARAMMAGIEARGLVSVTGLAEEGSAYASAEQFREGSVSELGMALLRFTKLAS